LEIIGVIIQAIKVVIYIALIIFATETWDYLKKEYHITFGDSIIRKSGDQKSTEKKIEKKKEKPDADKSQDIPQSSKPIPQKIDEKKTEKESTSDIVLNFEKGFEDVAKKNKDSVVSIAVVQLIEDEQPEIHDLFRGSPFDDFFKDFFDFPNRKSKPKKVQALGSGFIVSVDKDKMYIATNNHVVEKAKKIVITLADKTELQAELHASDPRTDIAVISVNLKGANVDRKKLKAVTWGDSDDISEGNFVVAIGNPFGFGSTVTSGIISSKGRNVALSKPSLSLVDDFIQHSAPINMGSSGGCLLNVHGSVIGINNAIITTNGGNIGIGFAIPSNIANITIEQLIKHKRTFRGWLGVEVQKVDGKLAESIGLAEKCLDSMAVFGAYVAKVVPNGPADKAGLKVGDIIIEFNGVKISKNKGLQSLVGETQIGKAVKLQVWRHKDGDKWGAVELSVNVGDFEKAMENGSLDGTDEQGLAADDQKSKADIPSLGITVAAVPEKYRSEYPPEAKVIVTKIDETSELALFDLVFMPGDVILSASNVLITSVAQFEKIMNALVKAKERRPIPFVILRGRARMMVATTIDLAAGKAGANGKTAK
jgi:serine protease Do